MATDGIDVSYWQGTIDWDKVKANGIEFAILRCGYGSSGVDTSFERNVRECERVGIPWGAYYFCYARSEADARRELANCLRILGDKKPLYPVYYDLEDDATIGSQSDASILRIARLFADGIKNAGFWAGIYASVYWFQTRLTDPWYDTQAKWVAEYNDVNTYNKPYGIWQYTSTGIVNGINGYTDLNYGYVNYPELIRHKNSEPQYIGGNDMARGYFQKGDVNEGVYAYKQLLLSLRKAKIITQGVDNNNIFGDGTEIATRQVQTAARIEVDGLAGPRTIRACYILLLNKIC